MDASTVTTAGPGAAQRPRFLRSLGWAVLVPTLFGAGGYLAQYPMGLIFAGVLVALVTLAVAATLAGGVWHRPGAAVLASVAGLALTFFAGPGLYEVYMKTLGDPVPAIVAKVENKDARRGASLSCAVVVNGERKVRSLSEQQNCGERFKPMQVVELRTDPLGILKPRLPDGPGQEGTTRLTLLISAGLYLLTGATMLYAGLRRRPGKPVRATRGRAGEPLG